MIITTYNSFIKFSRPQITQKTTNRIILEFLKYNIMVNTKLKQRLNT